MVAADVLLLLHVPPGKPALKLSVVVDVPQTANVLPVIAGVALSVITTVAEQPAPGVTYVIVVVPGPVPVIIPVEGSIVAADALLLLQVPPGIPALKLNVVVVLPQTMNVPAITGVELSVTTCVAEQPTPGSV